MIHPRFFISLTREQEYNLISRAQSGCIKSRNKLALAHYRLILAIARIYSRGSVAFCDLMSEGYFGLCRAIQHFDPTRGAKFSTFAVWPIQQSMSLAMRRNGLNFTCAREYREIPQESESDYILENRELVNQLLKDLDADSAHLIRRRFGLGIENGDTAEEFGQRLGVSKQAVCQREKRIMEKIRKNVVLNNRPTSPLNPVKSCPLARRS